MIEACHPYQHIRERPQHISALLNRKILSINHLSFGTPGSISAYPSSRPTKEACPMSHLGHHGHPAPAPYQHNGRPYQHIVPRNLDNVLILNHKQFERSGRHSFITPTHIAHNSFRHAANSLIVKDERFVRQERHTFIRDSDMYKRGPLCAPRSEPAQCPKPSRLREDLRIELREELREDRRKGHLLNHWT